MTAYLHSLATAVPVNAYPQERILEVMKAWHGDDRRTNRLLAGIYRASAIENRHSVIGDFREDEAGEPFLTGEDGTFRNPTTAERNELYRREAGRLAVCAAGRALAASEGVPARSVTHVITVSCTGFYAPGPDLELVRDLGLPQGVERYHLGFMGCYGAFPALRLARALCAADPRAVVLVVSVELCTLHLQRSAGSDELLAASVFADGAAAALVTARPPDAPSFRLGAFSSSVAAHASGEMAWAIGDTGFEMTLTGEVPRVVEREVAGALAPLWEDSGLTPASMGGWTVHPGGRAILDSVERALDLPAAALARSREVLARYGNMSSATVLFILERLLGAGEPPAGPVTAVAFGPGLVVESALLEPCA